MGRFVRMKGMCVALVFAVFGGQSIMADDAGRIRAQFQEYFTQQPLNGSSVQRCLKNQRTDGTWPDIDYSSQRRGGWSTLDHLERVELLARAYASDNPEFYQKASVRDAALRGLQHWIVKDYSNPNWWYGRIGVPKSVATCMILLGGELPSRVLEDAKPILSRSKMGMTGQNKVWCAGNDFMKGLLYGNSGVMKTAAEATWSELRVSTEEGIQPDWSFHQHGPQQQFGNYGSAFGGDMIQWGTILRGTEYALAGEKREILRNYLLEGPSWILWKGRMDLSGCGRQIDKGCQQSKGRTILRQLESMKQIDPEFRDRYAAVEQRIGFKPFWRSDMGVQRRPDWYASVKMSSTRVIGSETCNSENMLGLHLGDGVLLTYLTGKEYEDIVPLWDWKRLPGTTCDQGLEKLEPKGTSGGYGGSDFAGVLGDGETGVAAMIYQRNLLTARKSWFFLKDHMVCLGAGIGGETKGPVYSSLQQSWLKGKVKKGNAWIHHAGIGYQFFFGLPKVKTENVEGNWKGSFPTRGDRPADGNVFSLWIDHGSAPQDAKYAYRIFHYISAEEMATISPKDKSSMLINTAKVQAIENEGTVYAVFYEAGKLKTGRSGVVEVDGPCLLMISDAQIIVSDPTHALQRLEIKYGENVYDILLPDGTELGKQVVLK
jgi:chondroitin AC lyase